MFTCIFIPECLNVCLQRNVTGHTILGFLDSGILKLFSVRTWFFMKNGKLISLGIVKRLKNLNVFYMQKFRFVINFSCCPFWYALFFLFNLPSFIAVKFGFPHQFFCVHFSLVWLLDELPCACRHVLLLWSLCHSIAQGKVVVEALHYPFPAGMCSEWLLCSLHCSLNIFNI